MPSHHKQTKIAPEYQACLEKYRKTGVWEGPPRSGRLPKLVEIEIEKIKKLWKEKNMARLLGRTSTSTSSNANTSLSLGASNVTKTPQSTSVIQTVCQPPQSPNQENREIEHPSRVASTAGRVVRLPTTLEEMDNLTGASRNLGQEDNPTRSVGKWLYAQEPTELCKAATPTEHLAVELLDLDAFVWHPIGGRCVSCNDLDVRCSQVKHSGSGSQRHVGKLIYRTGKFPYILVYCELYCGSCKKRFRSVDQAYLQTLPYVVQNQFPCFVPGDAKGIAQSVLQKMRNGEGLAKAADTINYDIQLDYWKRKQLYYALWNKAMSNPYWTEKPDKIPPFPHKPAYKVSAHFMKSVFIKDFIRQKRYLQRELRMTLSTHSFSLDHQRRVVKKIRSAEAFQGLTVTGDHGTIIGVYVTPSTSLSYVEPVFDEIKSRHGERMPKALYLDMGCCTVEREQSAWIQDLFPIVKLDSLHLMLRLSRCIPTEHSRHAAFMKNLSRGIFIDHAGDLKNLTAARLSAKQVGPPTKSERMQYVRRVIPSGSVIEVKLDKIVRTYVALDDKHAEIWREQAISERVEELEREGADSSEIERATKEISMIQPPVGSSGWRLLGERFFQAYHSQLRHIRNNCVSDPVDPTGGHACFVKVGTKEYRNIKGLELSCFKSLRGSSRCETVHSVLDRLFYNIRYISPALFDARLWYFVIQYNRRVARRIGLDVPDPEFTPLDILLHGAAEDYADFRLAAEEVEDLPVLGAEFLEGLELCEDDQSLSEELRLLVEKKKGELEPDSDLSTNDDSVKDIGDFVVSIEAVDERVGPAQAIASAEAEVSDSEVEGLIPQADIPPPPKQLGRKFSHIARASGGENPYPIEAGSIMENAFEDILEEIGEEAPVDQILRKYVRKRDSEIKAALETSRAPIPLHRTNVRHLEAWLRKRKAARVAVAPQSLGIYDTDDMRRVNHMHQLIEDVNAVEQAVVAFMHEPAAPSNPASLVVPEFEAGPQPITKEAIKDSRRLKRKRNRENNKGVALPGSTSAQPKPKRKAKVKPVTTELLNKDKMRMIGEGHLEGRKCSKCGNSLSSRSKYEHVDTGEVYGHKQYAVFFDDTQNEKVAHAYSSVVHQDKSRSQYLFCPLTDPLEVGHRLDLEQTALTKAAYKRWNEKKKAKNSAKVTSGV